MYLHFQKANVLALLIYHSLWQHRLNHLINVIVWLEIIWSRQAIVVNFVRWWSLWVQFTFVALVTWCIDCPIEDNITSSLMPQLQSALGLLLRHPSEDKKSLFGFVQISWFLSHKAVSDIDFSCFINSYKNILLVKNRNYEYLPCFLFWSSMM